MQRLIAAFDEGGEKRGLLRLARANLRRVLDVTRFDVEGLQISAGPAAARAVAAAAPRRPGRRGAALGRGEARRRERVANARGDAAPRRALDLAVDGVALRRGAPPRRVERALELRRELLVGVRALEHEVRARLCFVANERKMSKQKKER